MSNRKVAADLHLNNHFAEELNDYFAKVCFDDSFVAPDPVYLSDDITVLKVDEMEVFVAFSNARRKATSSVIISFWIWRDYADIGSSTVKQGIG